VLLILAGAFVTYYAWVEVQELNGNGSSTVVSWARDVQSSLQRWAEQQGAGRLALGAVVVIGIAVLLSLVIRKGGDDGAPGAADGSSDGSADGVDSGVPGRS